MFPWIDFFFTTYHEVIKVIFKKIIFSPKAKKKGGGGGVTVLVFEIRHVENHTFLICFNYFKTMLANN